MEGRAPHARKGGITPTPTLPPLGSPASRQLLPNHDPPRFTSSLAKRTHRVRPSEKTAPRVVPGLSPLGCPCKARPRLGGAGSARPQGRHHANPSAPPFGHRPFRPPTRNHDMPRLASGLATRTHRVRPSEKTASRVVPGLSPLGCPCEARPRLGGAGSARPQGRHHANPSAPPFGHRPFRPPTRNHDMPRLASGLATRTHRVRPSEKTASRVVPGLSPLGCPCEARPRLGGAGSARPQGRHDANPSAPPFGHRPFRPPTRNHDMPRLASGLATRTHGVRPSEKNALRVIPGFSSPRPSCPGWPTPEGRAPHVRKGGITPTPTLPPFGVTGLSPTPA
jgi:hypothetical protein